MNNFSGFNDHSIEKKSFVKKMFDNISGSYDVLNGVMSLGIYKLWHRRIMKESGVTFGGSVIDFCTGTGELLIKFYKRFGLSKGVGIDISQGMLDIAQKKIEMLDTNKLELRNVPAEDTGISEEFDASTIAFALRNVSDVQKVFSEMARVTKEGGKVLALELTKPKSKVFRKLYKLQLKVMIPLVGKVFSGNREAYKYLGESIINFPEADVILDIMKEVGLKSSRAIFLTGGIATLFIGEK